jgi:mono/diheme cytochrome c family protein
MARFVERGVAGFDAGRTADLRNVIAAVSAEAELPARAEEDSDGPAQVAAGLAAFAEDRVGCARCHTFRDYTENDVGPVLTGWGSREWILGMLHNPSAAEYYGADNDGMPAFGVEGQLTEQQMGLIADWLRGDWYEPGRAGSR